jgi:hypothetical protein
MLLLAALIVLNQRAASAQWSPDGNPVTVAPQDQIEPAVCSDGFYGAIVAWADARTGPYNFDIYAQRLGRGGNALWTANGVAVCTAALDQQVASPIADGAGGAIFVWQDSRDSTAIDLYAQHLDALGTPTWGVNGIKVCDAPGDQLGAVVVTDGAGGAIVVWGDRRDDDTERFSDIYAQRISSAGVAMWAVNGVPVVTEIFDQIAPSAIPDGAGGVLIAWEDGRNDDIDIYAQALNPNGTPRWPVNGLPATTAINDQTGPSVCPDGAGGLVVAWSDTRDEIAFTIDIYAQRLNSNGAPQWTAGGVPVCDATGDQSEPRIVTDGAGGAIATWNDTRGLAGDVFAQRVNGAGARQWLLSGLPICARTGGQHDPVIIPDGSGGAIIAWPDGRNSLFNTDIYAQRVNAGGTALWPADGLGICTASADQIGPALTTDQLGGAYLAWEDGRSGTSGDAYAQRVTATGTVAPTVGVLVDAARPFRLAPPHPNPTARGSALALTLPVPRRVNAAVFDPTGRRVRTLLAERELEAGDHEIAWDGRDDLGAPSPGGVFFVEVRAGSEVSRQKIVRLR